MTDIRAMTVLPARRTPITLTTEDGLRLIGELALPADRDPAATLVCLHPLPTHGGMMDSHVYRKAANRLPALADVAVLRFNTRGTVSEQGKSEGEFGAGETERYDVAAAVELRRRRPACRRSGCSAGRSARSWRSAGACCPESRAASCCHRRCAGPPTPTWTPGRPSGRPLTVLVPEFDDYLRPDEARSRFARVPKADVIGVPGAKHLWVGENYVRIVLNEIVRTVNPTALTDGALPTSWDE